MTEPPTRMCVLAEPYLRGVEARSLEYAVEETGVEIPHVIVNEPEDPEYDPEAEAEAVNEGLGLNIVRLFFDVLRRERAWTFVIAEKKLAELLGSEAAADRRIPVEDVSCLSDSEFHHVTPLMDGNWAELPTDVVNLVDDSCDAILRYGFGLIRGDILHATEYGVLSFHPADIRQYRGLGPPVAFLDGRETMGVTLQRLSEEIDGGEIVAYDEIDVRHCATLWEVYDELEDLQVALLAEGIETLRNTPEDVFVPDSLGPYYSTTSRRSTSFAGRTLYKNMVGRVRKRISR